jgi:RNA polymerase sigma-70 factor (ECF subfamily)
MLEDSALIERSLAGKRECFDVLFARHQSAVRKRIRSMAGRGPSEDDRVQQVFLKAWCHLSTFRSESSFRTWIIRIATNEVFQGYRREHKSPLCAAEIDLGTFSSNAESPLESLERKQEAESIRDAIARLPRMYREVLVMRYLEERSELETSRALAGSLASVKSRLFRARRMLLAAVQSQGRPVKMPKRIRQFRIQRRRAA